MVTVMVVDDPEATVTGFALTEELPSVTTGAAKSTVGCWATVTLSVVSVAV